MKGEGAKAFFVETKQIKKEKQTNQQNPAGLWELLPTWSCGAEVFYDKGILNSS